MLVTNNAKDFLGLAEQEGFHPGLVFLPLGSQEEMRSLMRIGIEEIERLASGASTSTATLMINNVLDVDEEGLCNLFEHPKQIPPG